MFLHLWKPVSVGILCAVIISVSGRPAESQVENAESEKLETAQIIEHRANEEDAPVQSVPFYGGAKGKYLLIHPSGRTSITNRNPSFYGLKGEEDDGDEDNVGMEEAETSDENESTNSTNSSSGNPDESVCVGLPPDNASVAEAKPVGLAVAGPGGVAASKPVGTAIVGPGGLAVAKPVATAIAGVPGAEGLVGLGPVKKKSERPVKPPQPLQPTNKTKEEKSVVSRRSNENEYSNVMLSGHKVYYIPLYLPNAPTRIQK